MRSEAAAPHSGPSRFTRLLFYTLYEELLTRLGGRTYDFPYKAPVYASLVGLLNHNRESFGEDFVRRLEGSLTESLTQGEASHAKLCLRILAELANANVVPIEDLLSALQELLGAAADAEDRNGLQLCCHSMCDTKEKQRTL